MTQLPAAVIRGMYCSSYYRFAPAAWGGGLASELVEASVARWRELDEVQATYTDVVFALGLDGESA